MSSVEISHVVAQLRSAAALAGGVGVETESTRTPEFSGMLKQALDQVSALQSRSSDLATRFELGDPSVDLPQVMVASEKAGVAFEATKQVRNRLIAAYQEIMNMPI